ncbi:DM13 domain-containing protein [Jeongeupia naejangsanensis]|uniref:DM13 domain-containing protein n=1 Tax=Jeongeupia naejangsanensis TaxID=613195 RepID=A0ABS2BLK0_9NEIS|nr:DM13 domain-containing protein [Jeongeupia naejangsanensis]MBM3116486.1 DM13 domain-containing protein [Jeongeupia naejangsanensis]
MKKWLLLGSHLFALWAGFGLGVYLLPILTAPDAPSDAAVVAQAGKAHYVGQFRRELRDSDALHWGEGKVSLGAGHVSFEGRLAPGPDYRLYLSPAFVETEADFMRLKDRMVRIGEVKTFENFLVPLPASVDPVQYNTVIIWCEAFGQFITAAQYRAA